jgi:Tol biopolymer transport system component
LRLAPGARLGPYEIVSALGAGGMGEVYRARDPRLGRDVAIKVVAAEFAGHGDRLLRFEREARAAAALNHPNILAVYDVGTDAGAPFIVSELLEGETLRQRLADGPLGIRRAVEQAAQIARGLAAAHDKGIVHRDLKPENVFLTRDGRIKILDFGLAKLLEEQPPLGSGSAVVTAASPTAVGIVLGTVGYMAPEQLRGLPVDQRADIFALGAILYELLSGRRAFARDTAPETMTAILKEEPADLAVGGGVPPALVRIVGRCLAKDPADRFQTARDLAFSLEGASDATAASVPSSTAGARAWPLGWIAGGLVLLIAAVLAAAAYSRLRDRSATLQALRFQIPSTVELAGPGNFSLSPDGGHLAFVGRGPDGVPRIWVRAMGSLDLKMLPGSEANDFTPPPVWSPDGRFLVYDAGGRLKKLDVAGVTLPQILCELPSVAVGGSWNRSGDIIVGSITSGLLRVRESGGIVTPVTQLDPARKEEAHLMPTFLPDGRHFVYLRLSPSAPRQSGVFIGTLDEKPESQDESMLMPYEVGVTYTSGGGGVGRLLFLRQGTLMARSFDTRRLALAGDPVPVAQRVGSFRDSGFFAVSDNGILVYRPENDTQIGWIDREGHATGRVFDAGAYRTVALSPDGTRAIASRINSEDATKADLWLFDLTREVGAKRLTAAAGLAELPVWSRDGSRVSYLLNHSVIRDIAVNGGAGTDAELVRTTSQSGLWPNDWSPDGRFLLYTAYVVAPDSGSPDLLVRSNATAESMPLVHSRFNEEQGRFSPNGRWVAYVSNESGVGEVYVRGFAPDDKGRPADIGGGTLVSRGGGSTPRWRADGRELFYLAPDGRMMAVDVVTTGDFRVGTPSALFQMPVGAVFSDPSADGRRFLLLIPIGATVPFTVVVNWQEELKQRVPTR